MGGGACASGFSAWSIIIAVCHIEFLREHHTSGNPLYLFLAEGGYAAASGFPVVECLALYACAAGFDHCGHEKAVVCLRNSGEVVVKTFGINLSDLSGSHNFVL